MSQIATTTRTVGGLLAKGQLTDGTATTIEKAVAAAYYAGQSDARSEERRILKARVESLSFGRYHRLQQAVVDHLTPAIERRAHEGLSQERSEILGWDFQIPAECPPWR